MEPMARSGALHPQPRAKESRDGVRECGLEAPYRGLEVLAAGVDNQVAARRQFGYRNEVELVAGMDLLRRI